jgi:hypothetical protein
MRQEIVLCLKSPNHTISSPPPHLSLSLCDSSAVNSKTCSQLLNVFAEFSQKKKTFLPSCDKWRPSRRRRRDGFEASAPGRRRSGGDRDHRALQRQALVPNPSSFPSQIGEPDPGSSEEEEVSLPAHFRCSICVSRCRGGGTRAASSNGREREREHIKGGGGREHTNGCARSVEAAALARS